MANPGRPKRLGKYDLVARIAKGGMAEIYLARQRGMVGFSRLVVVKRILPHLAEEGQFVRMFMEEARLAALINHPNVVQIYDVGQFEGSYYIAMEFIDGPSLGAVARHAREQDRAMPFAVAGEIIAQACDGLHAAHELQDESGAPLELVHRDVSPHNLMLTRGGQVKLVDFGIAKATDTRVRTHTGKIKGKYPYMSPEQCVGDPLDRRTDIFSLGVVFYELVVARRLFKRSTDLMVLKAITEEPVPDPREVEPALPDPVCQVILRSLARDPAKRFPTAAAMASAMRQVLSSLGVSTSPKTVGTYVKTELEPLVTARKAALQRVLQIDAHTGPPPVVDGLDAGHSYSSSSVDPSSVTPSLEGVSARSLASLATRHPRGRSRRWRLLGLVLALTALAAGAGLAYRFLVRSPRPDGPPLYFGLPPSFPARVARTELRPFLDYLERRVDRPVELVVTDSYRSLRAKLVSGKLHFANMPAFQFVLARHRHPDLRPLVSSVYEGARSYQTYIIVRDDSPIQRLEDLEGRSFCYVDPGSTSGYLLPRYHLRRRGLAPERLFSSTRFSGNHISVMKDVVAGTCDAGAVYSGAMMSSQSLGVSASRIRILGVAGTVPYDVITVAGSLPDGVANRLGQALLEMDPPEHLGRKIIGPTFRINGFVKPDLDQFELVERAARSEKVLER